MHCAIEHFAAHSSYVKGRLDKLIQQTFNDKHVMHMHCTK